VKKAKNSDSRSISRVEILTEKEKRRSFSRRVLIIDDDPDITLTFQKGIEAFNNYATNEIKNDYATDEIKNNNNNNKRIEVYTYNDPLTALSEFKPDFYDLLLIDINLPNTNGFELSEKILGIDVNVRICFMSSGEINREALREIHPGISLGCFIKKPVSMDYLVERIKQELD
jgi:DNA-binding response OmpR family regulator